MSLAKSSPSYGTQPYPTALLDIYRSIRLYCELVSLAMWERSRFREVDAILTSSNPAPSYIVSQSRLNALAFLALEWVPSSLAVYT